MSEAKAADTSPLVSVVMGCCNRPGYARQAVFSVLGQTHGNLELIVQDDSTTDEVGEMVASLGDERIVYTRNRPQRKTGPNYIAGYRKARGEYVSTLNDDDLYAPEYLATMVDGLERHPQCSIGFCDHTIVNGEGQILEEETEKNTRRWKRDELREGVVPEPLRAGLIEQSISGQFAMVRRSALDWEDFPAEVSNFYDYWKVYLALRGGAPAYYTPRRLTHYRVHASSHTSSYAVPEEMLRTCVFDRYIHDRMLADERLMSIRDDLQRRLAATYATEGIAWLRLGKRVEAAQALGRSLRLSVNRRALAGLALCAMPETVVRRLIGR